MFKVGDQFILEIEGEPRKDMDGTTFYSIKGAPWLGLSEDVLSKLERFHEKAAWTDGYDNGLADAWRAAKKIAEMSAQDVYETFDIHPLNANRATVFQRFTPDTLFRTLKRFEEKEAEILVGDEVRTDFSRFIVTSFSETAYAGIAHDGSLRTASKDLCKKTGKHFPEIAALLGREEGE